MNLRLWSPEEEQELIRLYVEEEFSVAEIAEHFNKKTRSIISKLVQLKVYKKPTDDKPEKRSVKGMLLELEQTLGIEFDGLNLNKKANLEKVVEGVKLKIKGN